VFVVCLQETLAQELEVEGELEASPEVAVLKLILLFSIN
jgi:hypothetical protein